MEEDALKLASQVDEIYSTKGRNFVHLNMKRDKPDRTALKKILLGPTGNLRAPSLLVGKTLLVGFDNELYEKFLA